MTRYRIDVILCMFQCGGGGEGGEGRGGGGG